jgi:invasion protein IalB
VTTGAVTVEVGVVLDGEVTQIVSVPVALLLVPLFTIKVNESEPVKLLFGTYVNVPEAAEKLANVPSAG